MILHLYFSGIIIVHNMLFVYVIISPYNRQIIIYIYIRTVKSWLIFNCVHDTPFSWIYYYYYNYYLSQYPGILSLASSLPPPPPPWDRSKYSCILEMALYGLRIMFIIYDFSGYFNIGYQSLLKPVSHYIMIIVFD